MRLRSPAEAHQDEGAITAEFAVALPAVIGVLALCLAAVSAFSTHTILVSLSSDSARGWARGQPWSQVQERAEGLRPGILVAGNETERERCVTLSMPLRLGSWIQLGLQIEETSCAPREP